MWIEKRGGREKMRIRQLPHSVNKSTWKQVHALFGMVLKCLWCMKSSRNLLHKGSAGLNNTTPHRLHSLQQAWISKDSSHTLTHVWLYICTLACACVWGSVLCHIPTVRGSVMLLSANMAAPLLWKLNNSSTQRGFCSGMRDNVGIWAERRGKSSVFRRQYSHSEAHTSFYVKPLWIQHIKPSVCWHRDLFWQPASVRSIWEQGIVCVCACPLLTFCDARYSMPRATW